MSPIRHLYIHIPFCPKICPYCSFYKEASDRNKTQKFLDALLLELDRHLETYSLKPETIFFGGGTPSALSSPQLDYLLTGLNKRLDLSALKEWTLEMNPATVSLEKATLLRNLGVNRISMGVQSWDPGLLETLGRVHSAQQAERSYEILRAAGFENVNLDLIFGVPGQTLDQWICSLEKTISLQPEHISSYCLTYEEDTAFFQRFQKGELKQDEDFDAELFEVTMDRLENAGYAQYELSNYAKDGRECLHNLAYWIGSDYLGLGPSAFSTVGNKRWQNISDTQNYSQKIFDGISAHSFEEPMDENLRAKESAAFSLRTNRGVTETQIAPWQSQIREFETLGFLEKKEDRLILTRRGKMIADSIAEAFV